MAYRRGRRQLRKRWYVDARIGKNVPIIGGTGFVAGTGRRPYQRRALATYVKRQVIKQEETKETVSRIMATGMTHQNVYNLKLNNIPQGTGGKERVGDSVFYCGFNLKFSVVPSLANTFWRIYVVRARQSSPTTTATAFDGASPAIGASLLFRNSDTNPDSYLNTDDVNVICSKQLKIDQKFTGETGIVRYFRLNCKIMKKYQFQTGSQEGEYYNYYLIVVPNSNVSGQQTIGSSAVGAIGVQVEQVYKDA